MPGGERSITEKIIDDIDKTLHDLHVDEDGMITQEVDEFNPDSPDFDTFPAIYIEQGEETSFGQEDSKTNLRVLRVSIWVAIDDADSKITALNRIVKNADNAMLKDLLKNNNAIITVLDDIEKPVLGFENLPSRAGTILNYDIRFDYVAGER